CAPVLPVVVKLVAQHARARRSPRQNGETSRIGDQPDLADRLHSLDVHQLLKQADRHLRTGQADAFDQLVCELRHVHGLRPRDAADIAVFEADQLDAGLARGTEHLTDVHFSVLPRSARAPWSIMSPSFEPGLAGTHFLLLPRDDASLYYLFQDR